jgi:hypothetical protein
MRLLDFPIALVYLLIARLRVSVFKDGILEFLRQIEETESIGGLVIGGLDIGRRGFSCVQVEW